MKCVQNARKGDKLMHSVAYLGENGSRCCMDQTVQLNCLVNAFKHRAKRWVRRPLIEADEDMTVSYLTWTLL